MSERAYDIVVFGATGFTGKLVAEYLVKHHPGLKWALAGRSREKLEAVRRGLGVDLPILIADATDEKALAEVARATKVVITTVGPYALHGAGLVAACVEHGTGYCDLTGEPQFVRRMIDQHHERARKTGARIVHCCGFDSIPSDLGVLMLQDEHRARTGAPLDEVRFILRKASGGVSGGTLASMLNILAEVRHDPLARQALVNPYILVPDHGGRSEILDGVRPGFGFEPASRRWTAPFMMALINARIVRRSNALLGYRYGRDFRYSEVVGFGGGPGGLAQAAGVTLRLGAFLGALALPPLRALLERTVLPRPGQGPSKEARESGSFAIDLIGLTGRHRQAKIALRGRIAGQGDPGYAATARMLSEAALCLVAEKGEGGVRTPASTMGSALLERLRGVGMTFST